MLTWNEETNTQRSSACYLPSQYGRFMRINRVIPLFDATAVAKAMASFLARIRTLNAPDRIHTDPRLVIRNDHVSSDRTETTWLQKNNLGASPARLGSRAAASRARKLGFFQGLKFNMRNAP